MSVWLFLDAYQRQILSMCEKIFFVNSQNLFYSVFKNVALSHIALAQSCTLAACMNKIRRMSEQMVVDKIQKKSH